jgi:hypothetical protein
VFGATVYLASGPTGSSKHYYLFFREVLSHDARFTNDVLQLLLMQPLFETIRHVAVWADCGPHFRCNEVLTHSFKMQHELQKQISHHLFAPRHMASQSATRSSLMLASG